jgi:8-oxo-dGTP pyrophosphatase MutT (NUDIX family)
MTSNFDITSLRRRLSEEGSELEVEQLGPSVAAVAIMINPNDRGGSILLIKRRERQGDPWSGQMAFPGGHRSLNDRTYLETAVREAREETGVELGEHEILGTLPVAYTLGRRVRVVPFVFQLKNDVSIHTNEEVAESFWVSLSEMGKMEPTKSEVRLEEGRLKADSYIYLGQVIWGLTFRIINMLLDKQYPEGP